MIQPLTPDELKRTDTPKLLALMIITQGSAHFKYLLYELNRRYAPEGNIAILPNKERIKSILVSQYQSALQNCADQSEVNSLASDTSWLFGILGL